jgi:tetratricopeptide (TPR) repeat protein
MSLSRLNPSEVAPVADRGARLVGWKDIAAYLGKTDRTAKRWRTERGLPVHRVPGTAKTSVYAYPDEVDRWLESAHCVEQEEKRSKESQPSPLIPEPALQQPPADLRPPARPKSRLLRRGLLVGLALFLAAVSLDVAIRLRAVPLASQLRSLLAGRIDHPIARLAVPEAEKRLADDFYLRGRYEWNQRTPDSLHRALDLFTQSIVHDPGDARAYAGLADTYDLLREYSTEADADVFPRAIAAAKKAVALDDSLAEAHRALAFAEMYGDWNFAGAETEFRRAIELDPRDPQARRWYANAMALAGRFPEALAQMNKAQELDPSSHATLADKGWMLFNAGRTQEGIDLLREVERSAPEFRSPHYYLMEADLDLRDFPSFLSEGQLAAQTAGDAPLGEIVAAAKLGYQRAGGRGLLQTLYAKEKFYYAAGQVHAALLAKTCILMGRKQEALDLLEDAYRHHDIDALTLLSDPDLLTIKSDPQYQALVRKINYPLFPATAKG